MTTKLRTEIVNGVSRLNAPALARWRLLYVGENENSFRTVHIVVVRPRRRQIDAFCELRGSLRTFSFDYIACAFDLDAAKHVDVEHWLQDYVAVRRKPRAPVRTDAQSVGRREALKRVKSLLPPILR